VFSEVLGWVLIGMDGWMDMGVTLALIFGKRMERTGKESEMK